MERACIFVNHSVYSDFIVTNLDFKQNEIVLRATQNYSDKLKIE